MQIVLEKQNGKINDQFKELIKSLEDGRYVISVRSINPFKTEREFQKEYFALVDQVKDITGDTRNEIHELFKIEQNVETTKDFDLKDWVEFLDAFKWYYYNKANIIL